MMMIAFIMILVLNNENQKANDFQVFLARSIDLTKEKWLVSTTRLIITSEETLSNKPLFVYCNLCESTMIGKQFAPLLDVYQKDQVGQPLLRPVVNEMITKIQIQVKQENGELYPFPNDAKLIVVVNVNKVV